MKSFLAAAIGLLGVVVLSAGGAQAAPSQDPQKVVDDAASLLRSMLADPSWRDFHELVPDAKGLVIIPDYVKAGFIVGGAGGQCVMVARDALTGGWTSPSFCLIGEASIGLQIGVESSQIIMLVMTENALEMLATGDAKLGGDAGVSFGLVGVGVEGSTTRNLDLDIYAFGRGQGLYGGVSIEGGWIGPDTEYNHAYYGSPVTAHSILIDKTVGTVAADSLRQVLNENTLTGQGG